MKIVDRDALNQARQAIKQEFGDLADLPEDVRNTITNTYYEFCYTSMELIQKRNPQTMLLANSFEEGLKQWSSDLAHVKSATKAMPDIIAEIRAIRTKGDHNNYVFLLQFFLDVFKYKIPNAQNKSNFRLSIERPFYARKVTEIVNLWEQI